MSNTISPQNDQILEKLVMVFFQNVQVKMKMIMVSYNVINSEFIFSPQAIKVYYMFLDGWS